MLTRFARCIAILFDGTFVARAWARKPRLAHKPRPVSLGSRQLTS